MRERDVIRRLQGLSAPGGDRPPEETLLRARAELRERRPDRAQAPVPVREPGRDRRWIAVNGTFM